jgi:hypothetical protein
MLPRLAADRRQNCLKRKGRSMATKERLAAMGASLCAVCSGSMVVGLVVADPDDNRLQLRTYVCAECSHCQTYSVDGDDIGQVDWAKGMSH